ncbi:uncharacterized protein P174DRAFT_501897 [Aspergillus novofumigatus IBT 16806]|uniref:Uncharacterized protein n=1 Tax=Aspergillus novofumigatus (strain IBT 16806) TaxID=1392255 RepID=A0A2I1CI56_ASPN1|nr:uncharacterized protein P174DRAFT_501897 [Aspergillus novofumigatus IBT 16806]PKX97290.1 hypothetical protein P174DRAFT_501897 [Aspergillus novofumigatus IBT 16806]
MSIIVVNAKGAADSLQFYRLLQREKGDCEFDPMDDFRADYFCGGYGYNPLYGAQQPVVHFCLVFTYDASSRESWDEMVAACERLRSRCEEDGVLPFLATMIVAMGEGEGEAAVSHAEAEAFATQQDCLFIKISPVTGRGIGDAVGSLVELAHGARDQYPMDQEGGGIAGIISHQGIPGSRLASPWIDVIPSPRRSAKCSKYIQWDAASPALGLPP